MKTNPLHDGEWTKPIHNNYRLICCDCGLTHHINWKINGKSIQFQAFRDKRATGQIRRYIKNKLVEK